MNETIYNLTSNYNPNYGTVTIGIDGLLGKMQYNYALLLFALSAIIFVYVLWNNFVRSPSNKKRSIKEIIDSQAQVFEDTGTTASIKVQRISRELDGHMIMFSLALLYISGSYYLSFR